VSAQPDAAEIYRLFKKARFNHDYGVPITKQDFLDYFGPTLLTEIIYDSIESKEEGQISQDELFQWQRKTCKKPMIAECITKYMAEPKTSITISAIAGMAEVSVSQAHLSVSIDDHYSPSMASQSYDFEVLGDVLDDHITFEDEKEKRHSDPHLNVIRRIELNPTKRERELLDVIAELNSTISDLTSTRMKKGKISTELIKLSNEVTKLRGSKKIKAIASLQDRLQRKEKEVESLKSKLEELHSSFPFEIVDDYVTSNVSMEEYMEYDAESVVNHQTTLAPKKRRFSRKQEVPEQKDEEWVE